MSGRVGVAGVEQRNNLIDEPVGLLDLFLGVSLIFPELFGGFSHFEIDPAQDRRQFLGLRRSRRGLGKVDGIEDRLHLLSRGRLASTC